MAVSIVEFVEFGTLALGTSPNVTFTTTPAAGDVVVVAITNTSTSVLSSVSGLGASWSVVWTQIEPTNRGAHHFAVGTGATTSGTVTASLTIGRNGRMVAYLVRGLPSGMTWDASSIASSSGVTSFDGPVDSVTSDSFLVAAIYSHFAGDTISWSGSGASWTLDGQNESTSQRYATVHGIASSAGTAQGTASTAGATGKSIAQLVGLAPLSDDVTASVVITDHADEVIVTADVSAGPPAPVEATAVIVDKPDTVAVFADVEGASEDDGQETYPTRVGIRLGYLEIPPAALPPEGITPKALDRRSHVVPVITGANAPLTEGVDYPAVAPVAVGALHVFVDGADVTYLSGVPIQALRWSKVGPLGDVSATFELPGMHAWDQVGVGAYAMMRPDAVVEAVIIDENGDRQHLFKGFLSADQASVGESKRHGFTAEGVMWQAGHTLHEPPHYLPPTDIGRYVPRLLNNVPAKRWNDIPEQDTGLMTRHRGAGNQYVDQVTLDVLAKDGWTDDGQQWTLDQVGPDDFRMVLKPAMDGTYDDTVTYGAFGIEVNLSREQSSRADVIKGRGVTAAGGQWRGTRFPGLVLATPPPYPNGDARSMRLGDNDGDTDTGTGISDMQRRLNELGYGLRVDGVLNSNDITAIRHLQSRMGLLVDGVVGPQTWSGIFNRGPEGIDLTQWREPIAALPWTQKYLRDPAGVILGDNPAWDENRIPHEIEVDFGAPITWREALPLAARMLNVDSDPGLTGTIRMRTDFHNSWRGLAKPGMRVRVLGFQGEDIVVRVAAVDAEVDRDGLVVTLTVDERARDALNVAQILERNRAALADPARRPGNPNRDSRNERDRFVQWDIDSPCGFMPRTALFGGLWVAPNPIPFAEVGRIVRIVMSSTVPFAMGIFGLPVKPSQVAAIVGDPFASSDPWRPHTDALDRLGWIDGWGGQGQRMGYYPGDEGSGYDFSGRTDLRGPWDFISGYPPYVWPVFYSATTGFIGGGSGDWVSRFYPATGD